MPIYRRRDTAVKGGTTVVKKWFTMPYHDRLGMVVIDPNLHTAGILPTEGTLPWGPGSARQQWSPKLCDGEWNCLDSVEGSIQGHYGFY